VTKRFLLVAAVCAALAACSSGSKRASPTAIASTITRPPPTAPATRDPQVWLCKPGLADNPCLSGLTATAVAADGTKTVERSQPAPDPKVDCFYVYPTVSNQPTMNATLQIDPAETGVAIAQASRYSQVCNVYAPMYRQITVFGLLNPDNDAGGQIAYRDVATAWNDYLARYNDGRGVVLIGHSQGAFILKRLIADQIETDDAVRNRVVSAILLGANVTVPDGKDVGGDLERTPACHADTETCCVMAYSSFDNDPPENAIFGRTQTDGEHVLCTNPGARGGGSAPLDAYVPARHLGGPFSFTELPLAATPWVRYPDLFTGECKTESGATWLQVNDVRTAGDDRPALRDALGPTWGLHIYDGNIALGNLVDVVRSQAAAYSARR